MRGNRTVLEEFLDEALTNVKINEVEKEFQEYLLDKNISRLDSTRILNKELSIHLLSDVHLFVLSESLNHIYSNNYIKLSQYFTDIEISEYSNFKFPKKGENILFKNVSQFPNSIDQFNCYIHIDELMQLFQSGKLNYNFDTQRDAKIIIKNNSIYKSININKSAVEEMADLIVKGEFIPNFITFNILKTGEEDIEYNKIEQILTIHSGELDVLDGMHRTIALHRAKQLKPELDIYFGLNITNFNISKAKRYIVQEDKKTPISKEHIFKLNDDLSKTIFDTIINESKDFKNKIASDSVMIDYVKYITSESLLRQGITSIFKGEFKNARESIKLGSHLAKQFDNLYGYIEEIKKFDESYKEYYSGAAILVYLILFKEKENPTDLEIQWAINKYKTLENSHLKLKEIDEIKTEIGGL